MATTQVNFNVSELLDGTGFILIETTGAYSAGNLLGWGAPNNVWNTNYFAEITIRDSLGNLIGVADTEFQFNGFASSPSSSIYNTPIMTILASSYGLT